MKEEKESRTHGGRFLHNSRYRPGNRRKTGGYLAAVLLLVWDGVLLYMIAACLIQPVYGAAFVAVVSVYLGINLN